MSYDGKSGLTKLVPGIIGCSPKSVGTVNRAVKEAKVALKIPLNPKKPVPYEKVIKNRKRIHKYLVEKYSQPVETDAQASVDINSQPVEIKTHIADEIISQTVETNSQNSVEKNSQSIETIAQNNVEKYSQAVEIIKQVLDVTLQNNVITDVSVRSESVKNNSQVDELFSHTNNFDNMRIGFYITRNGKKERQVIAIDGYLTNALATIGVLKKDVPQWVQSAVDSWSPFDSKLPITRQVKFLIMRGVVTGLGGDNSVFYEK